MAPENSLRPHRHIFCFFLQNISFFLLWDNYWKWIVNSFLDECSNRFQMPTSLWGGRRKADNYWMLALAPLTTQKTVRIIHLPFSWRNSGNKYFGATSFWQEQCQGLVIKRWKRQESLSSRTDTVGHLFIHSIYSSLLSTYCVRGVVLDAIDRAVPSLLELTCQWGNSDNEHINKQATFCPAMKENPGSQGR